MKKYYGFSIFNGKNDLENIALKIENPLISGKNHRTVDILHKKRFLQMKLSYKNNHVIDFKIGCVSFQFCNFEK